MKSELTLQRQPPPRNNALKSVFWALCVGYLIWLSLSKYCPRWAFGFHRTSTAGHDQVDLENLLLTVPDPLKIRDWSLYYTSEPHNLGQGLSQGIWTQQQWQAFGVQTEITNHPVAIPFTYPRHRSLTILSQDQGSDPRVIFNASLVENSTDTNPLTGKALSVPAFLSFQSSCTVNASFVYANFGSAEDFEDLARNDVDVTGKIAIIKAPGIPGDDLFDNYRRTGIAGYILYVDPQQDGDITEDQGYLPYPHGPARAPHSVFRQVGGSLGRNRSTFIETFPGMPISYADAIPILSALNGHGPLADELGSRWEGGRLGYRGVKYNVGPSPANLFINMENEMEETNVTAHNVIGTIKGEIEDEVVILGNHRDAWGAGAGDPNSGSAILNEVVRSFGEALRRGWRPLRTIIFISWDGHEPGMFGSTPWVEDNLPWLFNQTVAYLEVISAVSGDEYFAKSSPLFGSLMRNVTGLVQSPDQTTGGQTVLDIWGGELAPEGGGDAMRFVRECISSVNFGYGRQPSNAAYHWHSSFDTVAWMDQFGDPDWQRHTAIARIWSLLAARLVDSPVYPFNVTEYTHTLRRYLTQIQAYADQELNFALDFDALNDVLGRLHSTSVQFDSHAEALKEIQPKHFFSRTDQSLREFNYKYRMFERQFRHETPGLDKNKNIVYKEGSWVQNLPVFADLLKCIAAGDVAEAQVRAPGD
ncbi:Zn-dependent exopeptidase [Penicillium hispanicum]|uniref:Zn-dependent exopeptidase n=1 Tax=Penicillium hispanicum TaxID=1080232 RepID=UPI00253F8EBE|nr:Zn-dependent exopeptidase [Penicillium hispanicum]KAJ5570102.1 Zn-dependent exopeptidase [Penicillium hispanicum]